MSEFLSRKVSFLLAVGIMTVISGLTVWRTISILSSIPHILPASLTIVERRGITVSFPILGKVISSPLTIAGRVSGRDNWIGFEGQAGTVILHDGNNNILGMAILTATTDWMVLPTKFQTVMDFSLPQTADGWLVFKNENPSGDSGRSQEFRLPVRFSSVTGEKTTVKIFFGNTKMDPDFSCNKVFPVEREIMKTSAVARASVEQLLNGPTEGERGQGFFSSIGQGVVLQKITIDSGIAKVDFSDQLEYQAGGSCRVAAIRAQISETLEQFPAIKTVIISINGRTEDILPP